MEKLGIEEVKAVVKGPLALAELVDALADGVGLTDIGSLIKAGASVKPMIAAIKTGKLIPELKDLDEAEKAELKKFIAENFNLKDDEIELKIELALSVVVDLTDLLNVV